MTELEKFRIRWNRWLGQKCRADKPYWVTLLNTNWTGWGERVYEKNSIDCHIGTPSREYVKEFYRGAIELANLDDLLKLDNLYCTDKISSCK